MSVVVVVVKKKREGPQIQGAAAGDRIERQRSLPPIIATLQPIISAVVLSSAVSRRSGMLTWLLDLCFAIATTMLLHDLGIERIVPGVSAAFLSSPP